MDLEGLKWEGESAGRDRLDLDWCGQGTGSPSPTLEGFLQPIKSVCFVSLDGNGGPCAMHGHGYWHGYWQGSAAAERFDPPWRDGGAALRASRQGMDSSLPEGDWEVP